MTKDKETLYRELKGLLDNLPEEAEKEFASLLVDMLEEEEKVNDEGQTNILRFPDRND